MLVLTACAIVAVAALFCRRHASRAASERKRLLEPFVPLFDREPARGVDRAGFGTLTGRYRTRQVHLSLLAESLAFRRLPQLWCRIEVRAALGGTQILDVVRRSTNVEFYAPGADLPVRHESPAAWPPDTLVYGTERSRPLLERLADHAGPLLADPRLKEILVTPRGLRITVQACEGERGSYLLMRGSRFAFEHLAPQSLLATLDAAIELSAALTHRDPRHARLSAEP